MGCGLLLYYMQKKKNIARYHIDHGIRQIYYKMLITHSAYYNNYFNSNTETKTIHLYYTKTDSEIIIYVHHH